VHPAKIKLLRILIFVRLPCKFLEIREDIPVKINYDMISGDEERDGLKGYITSTKLPEKTVCEQYSDLEQVERAF
jgi:hypothetical protein